MSISFNVGTSKQFVQNAPLADWVIVHGFGRYPIIDTYIDISGTLTRVLPKSVTYDNSNQCTVSFSDAHSGFATLS